MAVFSAGSYVKLYHNGSEKFETLSGGCKVYGNLEAHNNGSGSGSSTLQLQPYGTTAYVNHTGSSSLYLRMGSSYTTRLEIYNDGHVVPYTHNAQTLGTSSKRWSNIYATTYYGDGSNLTGVNPTIADGCIYENNQTISSTVSTSSSKNSFAAGDINITGTLTVADNTTFVIL